jgi:DNA-binding PadR family transcriptional regulator
VVSTGNFYRDLQRLVSSGLVRTIDRAPEGNPRRAPYQITEAGRDAFRRWFVDLGQIGIAGGHEDELYARIAFLGDETSSATGVGDAVARGRRQEKRLIRLSAAASTRRASV